MIIVEELFCILKQQGPFPQPGITNHPCIYELELLFIVILRDQINNLFDYAT